MKFCEACDRALAKDTSTGIVKLLCACGIEYKGKGEDSLIYSSFNKSSGFNVGTILKFSSKDRVNQLVDQPCSKCDLKYMTLVGTDSGYWLTCECGEVIDGTELKLGVSI